MSLNGYTSDLVVNGVINDCRYIDLGIMSGAERRTCTVSLFAEYAPPFRLYYCAWRWSVKQISSKTQNKLITVVGWRLRNVTEINKTIQSYS